LNRWASAIKGVSRTSVFQKNTLQKIEEVERAIDNKMLGIRNQSIQQSRILPTDELLVFSLNFNPKRSRTKVYKLMMNLVDILRFFEIEHFLQFYDKKFYEKLNRSIEQGNTRVAILAQEQFWAR
jgi:hypothetical protein